MPLPDKCPKYNGFKQDMTTLFNNIFGSPESDPLYGISPAKYQKNGSDDPMWKASREPYVWTNGMKNEIKNNLSAICSEENDAKASSAWKELRKNIKEVKAKIEDIDGSRKSDPDLGTSSKRREYRLYLIANSIEYSLGNMAEKEKLSSEFDKMTGKLNKYSEEKEKYVGTLVSYADAGYLEDGTPENLAKKAADNKKRIDELNEEYKECSVDEIEKAAKSLEEAVVKFSNDGLEKERTALLAQREADIAEKNKKEEELSKSKQYIDLLGKNKEKIKKELKTEKLNLENFEKCYTELKEDEEFFADLRKNTGFDPVTDSFENIKLKDRHYEDCKELLENLTAGKKLGEIRNAFITKLSVNPVYLDGKADLTVREKYKLFENEIKTGNKEAEINDDERTLLSDFREYGKLFYDSLPESAKPDSIPSTVSGLLSAINESYASSEIKASEILENGKDDNTVIQGEKFTNGDHLVEISKRFGGSGEIKANYEKAKQSLGDADFENVSVGMYIKTKKQNISVKESFVSENAVKDVNRLDYNLTGDLEEKIKKEDSRIKEIEERIKSNNNYIEEKKRSVEELNKKRNDNIRKRNEANEERLGIEKRSEGVEKTFNSFLAVKFAYGDILADSVKTEDKNTLDSYKEKIESGVKKSIVDSASSLYEQKDIKSKKSNSSEFNTMINSLGEIKNLKDEKGNVNISSAGLCEKLAKLKEDAQKYIDAKKKQVFVLGTERRKFRLGYAESIIRYTDNMLGQYKGIEKAKENLEKKFEKTSDPASSSFWAVPGNRECVFENHIKPVAAYSNIISSLKDGREKSDFVKGNVVSEPKFDYQKAIEVQQNYARSRNLAREGNEIKNEVSAIENN